MTFTGLWKETRVSDSDMQGIARLVKKFDADLRAALSSGRSGLFRQADGEHIVLSNVPLGGRYEHEVIQIFADEQDLDFFFKLYLK